MPMLRAVPSTDFTADFRFSVFRSGSLVRAISSTWAIVTLPTLSLLGTPEPFASPAAFLSRMLAGGVLVMNVYERSWYTVTMTGMIIPSPALAVWALNALQKSMMLTPCWPRAGPTGGAGVALPAGMCSFTYPVIFFAMAALLSYSFSTFRKSSSTGVDRPKMVTITFTVARSLLTSSTLPWKFENGPSMMRTASPRWNWNFGFGFSADTETWLMIRPPSSWASGTGKVAAPSNPVTFGVFFTTCHVASFISMLIST